MLKDLIDASQFEHFEYKLLYLRPSPYSDERVAVGVVSESRDKVDVRFVSSVAALQLMERIFGEDGVEQFHFASSEVRRVAARLNKLEALSLPTDLMILGDATPAFTPDRNGLLANILESASCLIRSGTNRSHEVTSITRSLPLMRELADEISRRQPLMAKDMFHQKIKVASGETVELPILGNRIFGAPVSFTASDQSMRAESYMAEYHWLAPQISRSAGIYVLAPDEKSKDRRDRIEGSVRKLSAIGSSLGISVRLASSSEELASMVIKDEAA